MRNRLSAVVAAVALALSAASAERAGAAPPDRTAKAGAPMLLRQTDTVLSDPEVSASDARLVGAWGGISWNRYTVIVIRLAKGTDGKTFRILLNIKQAERSPTAIAALYEGWTTRIGKWSYLNLRPLS